MTTLTRWEPYRELATVRQMMDLLRDAHPCALPQHRALRNEAPLALDLAEKDDAYIVKASLPGVAPEDVEITLSANVLTIKGEMKEDKEIKEETYHVRERRFGQFVRSVTLPMPVNADKIEAVNEKGVLTLTLPKAEAAKVKKIEIKPHINGK